MLQTYSPKPFPRMQRQRTIAKTDQRRWQLKKCKFKNLKKKNRREEETGNLTVEIRNVDGIIHFYERTSCGRTWFKYCRDRLFAILREYIWIALASFLQTRKNVTIKNYYIQKITDMHLVIKGSVRTATILKSLYLIYGWSRRRQI